MSRLYAATGLSFPRMHRSKGIPPESEKDFMAAVTNLALLLKWRVFHPHFSMHSTSGWPDLSLIRPPRFLVAELKAEAGRLTLAQETWIADFRACGVEAYVWRPSDWDEIKRVLR